MMRNLFIILMSLAFATVFPASKSNAYIKGNFSHLCFGAEKVVDNSQCQYSTLDPKDNSFPSYFFNCEDTEGFSYSYKERKSTKNEKKSSFGVFTTMLVSNYFVALSKIHYNKDYSNPYSFVVQTPIYILNHSLIIPFS